MGHSWKVLRPPSLSDHRYIYFSIRSEARIKYEVWTNTRNTNWDLYKPILLIKGLRPCIYNSHEEFEKSVTPQNGVLSPLLWTLVGNKQLRNFDDKASKIVSYAEDIAVLITENPAKENLLVFTRKYKIPPW